MALVDVGKVEEAEELITEKWNEPYRLSRVPQRMVKLYYGDEEREAIARHRARLLHEALEHHEAERYAASIPLVLAQIDGIFIDATGRYSAHFFARQNRELVDDETLAGHPVACKHLRL